MNRLLRSQGYLPAVAGLLLTIGTVVLIRSVAPRPPVALILILYLVEALWAAWCGFGPGLLNCVLMVTAVPWVFNRGGFRFNWQTFAALIFMSLLFSTIARNKRKNEELLRQANAELDERVRLRTAELQQANQELGYRLAELEHLYRKLTVGVAFLDTNLRFLRLNEELAAIHSTPVSACLDRTLHEVLSEEFAAIIEPKVRSVLETGNAVMDHEFRAPSPRDHSDSRDWSMSVSPVKAEDGTLLGVQLLLQDVTDRRRFDEQMRHTAKLESLGILAGGIAHDFNNLLTGILGNSSLAQDMLARDHPGRPLLDNVVSASERAADLTRQLLAYAGKGRFQVEPISLADLVRGLQPLISTSITRRAEIRLDLNERSYVAADPGQMQQLVMNLVINGSEAIPEGQTGLVVVRTYDHNIDAQFLRDNQLATAGPLVEGPYVCLEVHDTGSGMDRATLDRIFDPFFTTKFTGRGLGLAAVLGIVRGHRGGLAVSSRVGKGTTFSIYLPSTANEPAMRAREETPAFASAGRTILVVDDEDVVRRAARAALESYGYRVLMAESGHEAISFAERHHEIALVVLDLTMPGLDGEQTYRELQRIRPELRVILSSGYDESDAARRFAGQPLAGFVQKPYTAATLVNQVSTAMLQGLTARG